MKKEKNENYIRISSVKSLDDILSVKADISCDLAGSDVSAVSFIFPDDFCFEGDVSGFSEFITGLPVITAAQIPDPEKAGFDILVLFDRVISENDFYAERESLLRADKKTLDLYRMRCGRNKAYELEKFLSDPDESRFDTGLTLNVSPEDGAEPSDIYLSGIFKDKSSYQNKIIASCFAAARLEGSDSVYRKESEGFFKLVKRKAEEISLGNE